MTKRKAFKATATVMMVCEPESDESMRTGRDVAEYMKDIRTFAQEGFFVLTMDSRSRVINSYMVTLGTLSASLVHPREVFRPAIFDGAASIILVHNHPSGSPLPSTQDTELTARLSEAGRILGVKVTDHVIVGYERTVRGTSVCWYSFSEHGQIA